AVEEHRARTAVGGVTSHVGSGELEGLTEQVDEQEPRLDHRRHGRSVDGHRDPATGHLVLGVCGDDFEQAAHQAASSLDPAILFRILLVNTSTRCRLYSAVPR